MNAEPRWASAGQRGVLHVVGSVTDEVFSFLGPATDVIARSGAHQSIVMIDDQRYRHHVPRLHGAANVVLTPKLRNPIRQWQALRKACQAQLSIGPPAAVHMHGLMPCLACAWLIRSLAGTAAVYFSPHASRILSLLPQSAALLKWIVRTQQRRASGAIVNMQDETRVLDNWLSTELVESPVDDIYFDQPRREAPHPLVVTGGSHQSARSAELFEQFAVLLGSQDMRIGFRWIGATDPAAQARLTAAKVEVCDIDGDADCASHLASGWVYVASGATRGFPLFLVQAMAAGLACVVFDCPQHQGVIRHGQNGFVCDSEREMIEHIAMLIDSPALRERVGAAARASARVRFGGSRFHAKLLSAYAHEK
jgi:glycosyltransferase involved in cell wall biosynthesis